MDDYDIYFSFEEIREYQKEQERERQYRQEERYGGPQIHLGSSYEPFEIW